MSPHQRRRVERLLALCVIFIGTVTLVGYRHFPGDLPPEQPIPFSHRVHVGKKQISCIMCHKDILESARAGMPPVQTCMLCHERIIIHYPPIETLREHYFQQKPIAWTKVYDLPEYVNFPHQMHIKRGFDCGHCHGDVQAMDRIKLCIPIEMGYCISCHRDEQATVDCFTCHH